MIWNRYGPTEAEADAWERRGGTVVVAENGYCGRDEQGRQLYALAVHGHNGSGWFPVGTDDRFSRLGVELKAFRDDGDYLLVCGQRGIGSRTMASPSNWHDTAAAQLRLQTTREVRIRLHPGNKPAATPLDADLAGARACVVWSSASGVRALTLGIPVVFAAPHWICEQAATRMHRDGFVLSRSESARAVAMHRMSWAQRSVAEIESGEPFVAVREHLDEAVLP